MYFKLKSELLRIYWRIHIPHTC